MLILADWLEEQGDASGAAALRGLIFAGVASIHQVALIGAEGRLDFFGLPNGEDQLAIGAGLGDGFGSPWVPEGESGFGYRDVIGYQDGCGSGRGDGISIPTSDRGADTMEIGTVTG